MTTPRLSVYDPESGKYPNLPVANTITSISSSDMDIRRLKSNELPEIGETAVAYSDGSYLLAGGRTSDAMLSDEVYISKDGHNWVKSTPLPQPRARHAMSTLPDGSVIVAGGITYSPDDGCLELAWTILKYNFKDRSWTKLSDIPKRSSKLVVEVVNNKLFLIAGDTGVLSEPEQLIYPADCRGDNQILDLKTMKWSFGVPKPTPETGVTSAVLNDEIFVVSSDPPEGTIDALVEVYNTKTNSWRRIPDMPTPRTNVPCGFINGKLYCVNGLGRGLVALSLVEIYDPKSDSWTTKKSFPPPCHSAGYIVAENQLVLIGGRI